MLRFLWIVFLLWLGQSLEVRGHARLMSPPSRSSMWRLGFPSKKNFNDNALYCGGIQVQWKRNKGKCGICGDAYDTPFPRDNEAGGKYGQGIISRQYLSGQVMEALVDVTTNHRGYFEFKICPNNNPKKEATQECLDKHTLKLADGSDTKYFIAEKGNGDIRVKLQLPKGLTCSQCVFQWTYVAGNNWGRCEDGESRLGCGPQETFRGCADVTITKNHFSPWPNQNDIARIPSTHSFNKITTKQKHYKDTSIPKYAWQNYMSSKNTQNSKLSKWNVLESNSSSSPNDTSQSKVDAWKNLRKYFENWSGVGAPTAEEIFLGRSGSLADLYLDEETSSREHKDLSGLYQGRDVQFLRFYLQGAEPSEFVSAQASDSYVTWLKDTPEWGSCVSTSSNVLVYLG